MHATVSGCGDNLADRRRRRHRAGQGVVLLLPADVARRAAALPRPPRRSQPFAPTIGARRRAHGLRHARRRSTALVDAETLLRGQAAVRARADRAASGRSTASRSASSPTTRCMKGGVLFVDSADKAARFIWCCDAFNIPLRVPRRRARLHDRHRRSSAQGIIRHGAKMITAVVRGHRAQDLRGRAQGLRRRPLRHVRPGVRARGHPRPAHRQDRGDGPRGGGQRRVRQQDRGHRRPGRAAEAFVAEQRDDLRGGRRPAAAGRRSSSSTPSSSPASPARRARSAASRWPTARTASSPTAATACPRSETVGPTGRTGCPMWSPVPHPARWRRERASAAPGDHVSIREVGPRDGLQPEAPVIVADRVRLIEALFAAGVRHIEVAAFVSPKAVPAMAGRGRGARRASTAARRGASRRSVPNARGAELALGAGVDELTVTISASETYNRRNVNRSIAESVARCARSLDWRAAASVPVDAVIELRVRLPLRGRRRPRLRWPASATGCWTPGARG